LKLKIRDDKRRIISKAGIDHWGGGLVEIIPENKIYILNSNQKKILRPTLKLHYDFFLPLRQKKHKNMSVLAKNFWGISF